VPEWASVLVGVGAGVVTTAIGIYYGEWLRDLRGRRKEGAELVTRVRVLLEDADPRGFELGTMKERNQRHGRELWARWYKLRQPFREFGLLGSPDLRRQSERRRGSPSRSTLSVLRLTLPTTPNGGSYVARRIGNVSGPSEALTLS
jgi:hypothetical protein